jgi:predicted NAD/FAD-dependent oxidoreductase
MNPLDIEVLVVGAGMAGLAAASELRRAGHRVVVLEKAQVGGRMASMCLGKATFDYGAQFITARDPRFIAALDDWRRAGVAQEWHWSGGERDSRHPRWRGEPAMAAIAKHVARQVEVHVQTALASLQLEPRAWVAELSSGETVSAGTVLLTPPVPTSLALLDRSRIRLPPNLRGSLEQATYEPCLAVMAVLDGPSGLPAPGGLAPRDSPISWIADNQMKGVSDVPAVTLHATGSFSLEHWESDHRKAGSALVHRAEAWLQSNVIEYAVHAWPHSRAVSLVEDGYLTLHPYPPLLIAGDAFVAPRVEGAARSGWAAADALKGMNGHG